jgi:hypothetical protein
MIYLVVFQLVLFHWSAPHISECKFKVVTSIRYQGTRQVLITRYVATHMGILEILAICLRGLYAIQGSNSLDRRFLYMMAFA